MTAMTVLILAWSRLMPMRNYLIRGSHLAASMPTAAPDFSIVGKANSRELLMFERMLRVKPYPVECPYDGIELFGAAEPLRLQPEPPRVVSAAVRRLYGQVLGRRRLLEKSSPVLEHVCDGGTRLPFGMRRRSVRLHASDGSLLAGREARVGGREVQHVPLSALHRITKEGGLQYILPYSDGAFEAVLSHDVVPYAVAPLPLFAELHRVLRPGGTLCVTFSVPPSKEESEWQYATCDPRSASLAWLQAADCADLLYMVGSFFFYSAEWAAIEVSEVLPSSAASPSPVYEVATPERTVLPPVRIYHLPRLPTFGP